MATAKRYTLGKEERLKSRKQIEQLFKEGKSFHTGFLKVYHQVQTPAQSTSLQFGVGAGTRYFKKAVDRNRIKRLMREAYRLQNQSLKAQCAEKGITLNIFFIFTGKELPVYEMVVEKTALALHKLQELYS